MEYQSANQNIIISFGKQLNKNSIQEQKEILSKVLALNKPIIFSANEVSIVDTAALQLLLSFVLTASKLNVKWDWEASSPSPMLIQAIEMLGMSELLRLPKK